MNKDEALKMAIKALEMWNGKNVKTNTALFMINFEGAINACKEALEQPAQEPVAYISEIGLGRLKHGDYRHGTVAQVSKERLFDTDFELYLHPHQWQGLTDDEILKASSYIDMLGNIDDDDVIKFARAIEQALKEKNCGI